MSAAQDAALPLNSTLYLPRMKEAIPTIKTRIVFRGIFIGRAKSIRCSSRYADVLVPSLVG
jgi:hypothetical protein